jgi:predicted nucleic acid-binding protein
VEEERLIPEKITFYDAAYHALAIHHRGTRLTADRAYVKKAARAGHIKLLSDWSGGGRAEG